MPMLLSLITSVLFLEASLPQSLGDAPAARRVQGGRFPCHQFVPLEAVTYELICLYLKVLVKRFYT